MPSFHLKKQHHQPMKLLASPFILFLFLVSGSFLFPVRGDTSGDYQFRVTNNGAEVTNYLGSGGTVLIPEHLGGVVVKGIGDYVFKGKTTLTDVKIPDSVTVIGFSAFEDCTRLTNAALPKSLTSIGSQAFNDCHALRAVTIPESVNNIGTDAFSDCVSLTDLTIPRNVAVIGAAAFAGCTKLTNIVVKEASAFFTSADGVLFDKTESRLVAYPAGKRGPYIIPSGVTSIDSKAFFFSTFLTSVTIPEGVVAIEFSTFENCTRLTNIMLPNSLTRIESQAFKDCHALRGVKFPNDMTKIGTDAFSDCTSLTKLVIPISVKAIGAAAFAGCAKLTEIVVDEGSAFFTTVHGVLFDKTQSRLLWYPISKRGPYIIPNTVTTIDNRAFYFCAALTSVTIPYGVSVVGYSTFEDCTSLTNVTLPDSLSSIAIQAFNDCHALKSVRIPNRVTKIEPDAFSDCTSLTSLTIPNRVTDVGASAFAGCTNLIGVYFEGNAPVFGKDAFKGETNLAVLYYLPGTSGWSDFVAGLSTREWQPRIQSVARTSGAQSNQFGFTVSWASGQLVVIEATTNLMQSFWQPISTNPLTGGSFDFTDSAETTASARFYRTRSP